MDKKKCSCGCNEEEHKHNHECNCGCVGEHNHEHKCDCGCEDDCCCDDEIVELTTDDGKKLKFFVIGTIEYKGKYYAAFEPAEEIEGLSEDDMVIFEMSGDGEESDLLPIEDDKLLDEVYAEFCKVLEEDEEDEN